MADLVVFGEDWGGLPSSTQHLIRHLLTRHRVIWINSIGMRSPGLNKKDMQRIVLKAKSMLKRTNVLTEDISEGPSPIILSPKVIPFHNLSIVRQFNKNQLVKDIREACKEHGFKDIILWTSLPTAVDVVGSLNEKASIYYCGDDFNTLDGVDHSTVNPMERELADKVDLILVVSKELAEKLPGPSTVMFPHGVDYDLFSSPRSHPGDFPRQGPVAGFYGSISEWLNVEMLTQAATALPGWQFVFVGTIKTDVGALREIPNVHFLGPRPHSKLPAYVQNWDVAMLPFCHNRQIEACNPLKLREYLASGTAIASTDFPAVRVYDSEVTIQSHREPFSRTIQRAYDQKEAIENRRAAVRNESWESRAAQLEELIDHLANRQSRFPERLSES
ncbi:glycosyltransferase [Endozoicomonas numazuensis]|uniref:glycosyltransferase n=1 Tax=Endozoicomonas numazuensis TaxID=1137799 RepID=UPI00068AAE0F|nr:glycosyltransferase [Endozoicomonas numazuensis]